MTNHLDQAKHNFNFLDYLDKSNLSDDYCDWKITVVFYTALHVMRAYTLFKGKSVINSHREFHDKINPEGIHNLLDLDSNIFDIYLELYYASKRCRYAESIISGESLKKLNTVQYGNSRNHLEKILEYVNNKGMIYSLK
jgi:hypothetical protein